MRGVDDDDHVAEVLLGRVEGLILANKDLRYLAREVAYDLPLRIH